MSTVTLKNDAGSALSAPQPSAGAGAQIWQLRIQCGLIIGGVDALVSMLTGFSPLEEWVFKPLAGNWDALDMGATAWTNAGKAARAMADDLDSFPHQVGDDWRGEAALAWANANGKLVAQLRAMPEHFDNMATMCSALAEVARQIAGLIADLLSKIADEVTAAAVAAAIPIAGWAADGVLAMKLGYDVTQGSRRIITAIEKFRQLVQKLLPILQKLQELANAFGRIQSGLATAVGLIGTALDNSAEAAS